MATLTITSRGQVTFRKEVLKHLGIEPGSKIEIDLLPGGRATLSAVKRTGNMKDFIGMFAEKTGKHFTLEQLDQAAQEAWAGKR